MGMLRCYRKTIVVDHCEILAFYQRGFDRFARHPGVPPSNMTNFRYVIGNSLIIVRAVERGERPEALIRLRSFEFKHAWGRDRANIEIELLL